MESPALEIDCHTVQDALESGNPDMLLVDCREPEEHATVHITGATLLPMGQIADRIAELQPHMARSIVVYCHHGMRSLRVVEWLRQQGFKQSQSMAGGIDAWATEINPALPRY